MVNNQLSIVNCQVEEGLSIFDNPTIDTSYLVQKWQEARDRFLMWVLTRKGLEPENLRANTRKTYKVALDQFFDGLYDNYGMAVWPRIAQPWSITHQHIEAWRLTMGTQGKAVFEKRPSINSGCDGKMRSVEVGRAGISSASLALKLAALKEFFDFVKFKYELPFQPILHQALVDGEMLFLSESGRQVTLWAAAASNPFDPQRVERPRVTPYGRAVEPTTAEVAAIFNQINLETVHGKRDYALLLAFYSTACRASEILNLKWSDLQETNGDHFTFSFRGKSGKIDQVALDREAYGAMVIYLQAAGRYPPEPDDYIFTPLSEKHKNLPWYQPGHELDRNRPLDHDTAAQILKRYARLAGVDSARAHLHGLRHAATQETIEAMERQTGAVDVLELKRLLRHSNLNTTQIYAERKRRVEDPYASARIAAVRPSGVKPKRAKAVPEQQLPLETAEETIARLQAEIERLKRSGARG